MGNRTKRLSDGLNSGSDVSPPSSPAAAVASAGAGDNDDVSELVPEENKGDDAWLGFLPAHVGSASDIFFEVPLPDVHNRQVGKRTVCRLHDLCPLPLQTRRFRWRIGWTRTPCSWTS